MGRVSQIDPEHAPREVQEAIRQHLEEGHQLTNEKKTLLHSVAAFRAVEEASYDLDDELQQLIGKLDGDLEASYDLDDELQQLIGKLDGDLFEYAISVQNECLVCTTYFGKLLRNEHHIDPNAFRLTRREELLMQYARSLARDPKGITDKAFQELKEEFLQNGDGDGNPVDEEKAERMGAMMIANNTVNDALQVDV